MDPIMVYFMTLEKIECRVRPEVTARMTDYDIILLNQLITKEGMVIKYENKYIYVFIYILAQSGGARDS
jgi:hypothetical protein